MRKGFVIVGFLFVLDGVLYFRVEYLVIIWVIQAQLKIVVEIRLTYAFLVDTLIITFVLESLRLGIVSGEPGDPCKDDVDQLNIE